MHVLLHAAVAAMMASAAFSVAHAQGWSTAQLSQARSGLSATSVGTVAMFAGGFLNSKLSLDLLRDLGCVCLLREGLLIAVVRCVIGKWVFVFRDAVRERLLSYARHCS